MLSGTVLAVFLVPVFYLVVSRLARRKSAVEAPTLDAPVKGDPSHA
jgi:hypothetical protein